jgi:hypothetical protein
VPFSLSSSALAFGILHSHWHLPSPLRFYPSSKHPSLFLFDKRGFEVFPARRTHIDKQTQGPNWEEAATVINANDLLQHNERNSVPSFF